MAADGKRYWSYEQVHELVRCAVMEEPWWDEWRPTLIICIAAGGFVPTRILRSFLKHKLGANVPIQTIGLQLYDVDGCDPSTSPVQRTQWLSYGTGPGQVLLQGQRILIVDEVDDSRKTLAHALAELEADVAAERAAHEGAGGAPWAAPELGVFVLHNKQRPKLASLPEHIMRSRYWAGLEIEDCWCVYPWDALHIYDHTQTAEAAGLQPGRHVRRQSSGCPAPPHPGGSANGAGGGAIKANGAANGGHANGVHALTNGV
ncbi:XPT1 [Scenedesmus sp. PABB004]|nr:XPT1 [Scenedesmus sp. PABB004]